MYPGLFGEDSLITLSEARSGQISVWLTAWWVYATRLLTLNTRAVPVLTLTGVLVFAWSVRVWATSVFPRGLARAWATLLICASPLVGAIGIQLRHDSWMTAGLLLCLAVMARVSRRGGWFETADYVQLLMAVPLVATRHNGLPTLMVAAAGVAVWFGRAQRRTVLALLIVATLVFGLTTMATRMAGQHRAIDPVQTIEWLMADMSCLLTKDGVQPTADEWAVLDMIASRHDWPQRRACAFMNPIFIAPSFHQDQIEPRVGRLLATWFSLARRYPAPMIATHFGRLSLFLPPFVTGPDHPNTPFIHSTILPNDFGLAWAFPEVAETVRIAARAWNALRLILANSSLWLAVLLLAVIRRPDLADALRPALLFGIIIEATLLVTAPVSEGRYGLLILVTGQLTLLYLLLERWLLSRAAARGVEKLAA